MTLKFKRAQKKSIAMHPVSSRGSGTTTVEENRYLFKIISFESKWNQLLTTKKKGVDQLHILDWKIIHTP